MGRPSKYNIEMCKTLLLLMAEGASITEVAAEINVSRDTIYDWTNPESPRFKKDFSDSFIRGMTLAQAWWERTGRKNLDNNKFNGNLWALHMKNRYGWADRQQVDQTTEHKGGINIITDAEMNGEIKRVSDRTDKNL